MSTNVVLGGVGAVVGGIIGGPQGAMWGWTLGSTLGNAIDPPTIRGPSLGDMAQQTTQEGVPIPIVYGMSPPIAGNVMCTSPVRIVKKKSSGKGGPNVVTETALRTYGIQVCEGPIGGFLRVWRNNVKVYDSLDPEFTDAPEPPSVVLPWDDPIPSRNEEFLKKARFFLGTYDQDASEDLEAVFGAGTTPAHRGIAYMVIADEDVTDMRGAIPQWTMQVAASVPPIILNATPSGELDEIDPVEISATTSQASGTFYVVIGTGSQLNGVTAEQIKAGQKADGSAALDADSVAVTDTTPAISLSGLVPGVTYSYAAVQENDNGTSNIVRRKFYDKSLPVLSSPTPSGLLETTTEADVGATTNQPIGALYVVIGTGTQLDGITAQQIIFGQQANGSAALFAGNDFVTSSVPVVSFDSLLAETEYTYAIVQTNVNGVSNVVTGSFETAAEIVTGLTITAGQFGVTDLKGFDNATGTGTISDAFYLAGYRIDAITDTTSNSFWLGIGNASGFGSAPPSTILTSIQINGKTYLRSAAASTGTQTSPNRRWWQWLPRADLVPGVTYPVNITL